MLIVLRDRTLSPESVVTKEKELKRQSGSADETFRNTIEPLCSSCSPYSVEIMQQSTSCWKAGSDSIDEFFLAHSFCIEAFPLELGSKLTERSNMNCSSGELSGHITNRVCDASEVTA